jgi:LruC domain-containing protein
MRIKLLSLTFALAILSASCKKNNDLPGNTQTTGIDDIKVSDSFNWSSTNEINFSIGTSDSRFQNLIHVIYIYDQDPAQGGKILAKGAATLIKPFNTKIAFTRATKDVYIVKAAPNGTKTGELVSLNSKNINMSFGAAGVTKTSAAYTAGSINPKYLSASNTVTSAAAIPNCERSVTDPDIDINKSEVVCFSSNKNTTIDIKANQGGTLKISAPGYTVSVRNFNHTDLNIVIEANTKLVFSSPELKNKETWTNNGTIELTGKFDVRGILDNNGTANFNTLQINGGGTVNNYCKLTANEIQADDILNNYSYVLAKNSLKVNGSGKVNLNGGLTSGAYLETKDLVKGGNHIYVFGSGATSLFKVTGSIDGNLLRESGQSNNSQIVGGTVQLCTSVTGIPSGFFSAPAALGCEAYIEKGDCMLASNGTPPTTGKDSDGDGVIDKDDDYPDDETKAFKTYSVNYDAGGSTLAFEDNWPIKGDYDLNDVVLTYRYMVVTNATNKVVEVSANYSLIATGADYINGAGIQFPLATGKAKINKAPKGVYLEEKQDSVVLILFDNSRKVQATGNTVVGKETSPAAKFDIVFEVTDGPEIKNFGAVTFNPFIWNATNGFGRGYETHLYGKGPTNLANKDLFETKDDFSKSNNKYYSTKEKLPWVIEVPVANFGYPIEGSSIDKAYTNFADWANSGGNSNLEWYKILSGGANHDLIYPVK